MNPIGIGFVLKNDIGIFVAAGTTVEFCSSSEEAKCLGILTAARWAFAYSNASGYFFVETYCKATGEFLAGHQSHISWQHRKILQELYVIKYFFSDILYAFITRSANIEGVCQHESQLTFTCSKSKKVKS